MTSATDIITYIGVPLAVLGVLPILYTFILVILTQRRIRASLVHHGHRPVATSRSNDGFTMRSSPMTSLIEVELPRYAIAPLDRNNDDYWKTTTESQEQAGEHHRLLDRAESTLSMVEEGRVRGFLRGGSWRAFHWKRLVVGKRLYRIQYVDDLREPPAEVDFSELIHLLLDWGAVPDAMGWEKLKSGGLWTPTGTVLLAKPANETNPRKQSDWVLRTSMPDESDGVLSLTIRWTNDMTAVATTRGVASLPPGWGRLSQPQLLESNDKAQEETQDLPARIEVLKSANKHSMDSSSLRFRAEDNRVQRIYWERNHIETGFIAEPFRTYEQSTGALWFTCAASALLSRKQSDGGLWAFDIPSDIKAFVRNDSIPCGVMVILGLLAEADAPQWSSDTEASQREESNATTRRHMARFQARQAAERLEATMPPEQARIHKANRATSERQQMMDDMNSSSRLRQEREERRLQEAISSPRMSTKKVSEACLTWLIETGEIGREWTLDMLAEAVLYLLVVDQSPDNENEARKIANILEDWMSWATAGGMKKQQVQTLADNKVAFCFAVALVAIVSEFTTSSTGQAKAGADMLECLRLWRKVRLG
ncbi:hypothetical protein LTR10_017097 [Elasticomyces elasticus]|uniref:Uncharacterized protein n=1 Tax=Exophiala sideris TaxID=1016849 RepID=A0ABR0JE62_9EURO|nr:hypothetical protein LTR10_017097 [Elasticomyces elasticus]KAK5032605.1 hypothetical protein LTS07_004015 [Exophiala sideris]KAK5037215.1 hypothetical protein LTR13_005020 [Exophiala sideris]KAK5062130.1 hypothetical protein LTR69_004488 [Exophiala sideris]KAK5182373.1 hypothetical protein LTR44_005384 [Eurotiomycetes sp. CCFEE 6388]